MAHKNLLYSLKIGRYTFFKISHHSLWEFQLSQEFLPLKMNEIWHNTPHTYMCKVSRPGIPVVCTVVWGRQAEKSWPMLTGRLLLHLHNTHVTRTVKSAKKIFCRLNGLHPQPITFLLSPYLTISFLCVTGRCFATLASGAILTKAKKLKILYQCLFYSQ
jgi:hypothetical protein